MFSWIFIFKKFLCCLFPKVPFSTFWPAFLHLAILDSPNPLLPKDEVDSYSSINGFLPHYNGSESSLSSLKMFQVHYFNYSLPRDEQSGKSFFQFYCMMPQMIVNISAAFMEFIAYRKLVTWCLRDIDIYRNLLYSPEMPHKFLHRFWTSF